METLSSNPLPAPVSDSRYCGVAQPSTTPADGNIHSIEEEKKSDEKALPTYPPKWAVARSLSSLGPPPPSPLPEEMISIFLERQCSCKIDKLNEYLQTRYTTSIDVCEVGKIESVEGLFDRHHYKHKLPTEGSGNGSSGSESLKAILKELKKDLPSNLQLSTHASMFLRYDEERPHFLQTMLTGVAGSPYESGCFIFDIFIPDTYPQTNCLVTHTTRNASLVHANNGPGGFSPNLHRDSGKVCLSLLGTWDGPGWTAKESNMYQVLSTIQWMILNAEHPYYMEPGHGGWEGTAPKSNHSPKVIEYTERVQFGTAKWAILEMLKSPPPGFEEAIIAHFRVKWRLVLYQVRNWSSKGSEELQTKLEPVIGELTKLFHEKFLTVAECRHELSEIEAAINFIEEKMSYLDKKISLAGGAAAAKAKVPKAYKRWKIGPRLLHVAKSLKVEKQNQLLAAEQREKSAAAVETEAADEEGQGNA